MKYMTPNPTRRLINGVHLHVEAPVGAGEPLILVHGGWTDHNTWALLVPLLARSFRVISYDRRGHSLSERGPGASPRLQEEDDLIGLIEELGLAPVHLVGSSYGASIVLAVAGRRPDLVRAVVAHEPPLVGLFAAPALEELFELVQDQIAAGDAPGATRRLFEGISHLPGAWDAVPERVQQAAIANAQTFLDLREDPAWGDLDVRAVARFPGPITITWGDAGPIWMPRIAVSVADALRRDPAVIHGAGHTPHHTHPEAFAAVIAERLRGHQAAQAA
jgi:pimeloyl-ACP methyl ester carboxylesterase